MKQWQFDFGLRMPSKAKKVTWFVSSQDVPCWCAAMIVAISAMGATEGQEGFDEEDAETCTIKHRLDGS